MTARVDCNDECITWDERLSIESECAQLARVVHLQCPRLTNRDTVDLLAVGDMRNLNEDERMWVDELEIPDLDGDCESLLIVIDADHGMVTKGDSAPKEDHS